MKNSTMVDDILEVIVVIIQMILVAGIIILVLGLPTMLLWNWLMPTLFGLTKITFIEALGLNLLSAIIIRGFNLNLNKE